MLRTIEAPRVALPAAARSRLVYLYLLRVPILVGASFVALPYVGIRTDAASLLLGLFDVSEGGAWSIWAVSTSAFVLALTLMTTVFLVLAYSDERCGAFSFSLDYPIPMSWYGAASLLAIPTLAAMYAVSGSGRLLVFIVSCLLGLTTSSLIFWAGRRLVMLLDRVPFVLTIAGWLAEHPELGSGYVDLTTRRFLPGHRLAASLMVMAMALYAFIGWQVRATNGFSVPTLAYALLLLIVVCWVLGALAFFFDRYRVPVALLIALLVAATGFRGGSDHYFQLKSSWASEPLSPGQALAAHTGAAPRRSMIVVSANGGGIQASAWTARVLTGLADVCRAELNERCSYAESIRLISSVSGGTVGAMYFAHAYQNGLISPDALDQVRERAERSSLAYVGWGLLYRDLIRPFYLLPRFEYEDRGSALELAWQRDVYLDDPLEAWRDDVRRGLRPATIFNATISDSGERLLIGTANPPEAPGRRNFERVFEWGDVGIVTAARLSAAFPYVSPAARADNNEEDSIHFVDGGYYDTYGVSSLIDWLDAALYENQQGPEAARIDRILILQLRGGPPGLERKGRRRGWFYQAYAPLSALLGARDTGQLSHADQEITLMQRAWSGKVAISTAIFQFCGGDSPMSWHMTPAQKEAIRSEWALEKSYETTQAVINFLKAELEPDRSAGPSAYFQGRCRPTPAEAGS